MEAVFPREGQREKLSCRHPSPPGRLRTKSSAQAARSGGAAEREGDASLEEWLLGELAEKERTIVWLRCVRRMSYAEIARALNLSIRTVEKHVDLAIKQIRKTISVVTLFFVLFF